MYKQTAEEIKENFLSGAATARSIAEHFVTRIEENDQKVGAFLKILKERVFEQASKLDRKRDSGEKLGKLAGIPIAIKDNIHIEGELTTCGSKFLTNYKAPFSATVTKLLEQEDALIIGKTNLDEFAMGSSTENSALAVTKNPWNLNCVPGGSSGGSAAAVAARFAPYAFGSDTGGSIRQPAAFCGVVGFKPTYGRVSRYGLVAFGSSLDQIGPFATNVRDTALMMEVIGSHCEKDSTSLNTPNDDYFSSLDKGVEGMTIGIPTDLLDKLQGDSKEQFESSVNILKELGAKTVEVNLDLIRQSIAIYYILATAEASTNLARFDGVRYGVRSPNAESLEEVYDLSKEEGFGPEVKRRILLGTYVLSAGYQDAYYKKAQRVRTLLINQFKEAFKQCSLIAMPVSTTAPFERGAITDPLEMYLNDLFTIPGNLAGLPCVSVPAGFTKDGKPHALQLIGPQKQDPLVLQGAYAFEQAVNVYKQIPEF